MSREEGVYLYGMAGYAGIVRGCNTLVINIINVVHMVTVVTIGINREKQIMPVTVLVNPVAVDLSEWVEVGIIVVAVVSTATAGADGRIAVMVVVKGQPFINQAVTAVIPAVTDLGIGGEVIGISRLTCWRSR